MPESPIKSAASCTLCIVLAFFFLSIGLAKLVMPAAAQRAFVHWGHPDWFHLFVGSLEVVGAVLLLHRRTTTLAAAILGGVLLGAVATHLRAREFVGALLPAALLVPTAGLGYCRRLDATWMRRLSSRRVAGDREDAFDVPPTPFPELPNLPEAAAERWLVDPAFRLRITEPYHADVPDPVVKPGDQRWG